MGGERMVRRHFLAMGIYLVVNIGQCLRGQLSGRERNGSPLVQIPSRAKNLGALKAEG
jgi:hypothetical protein